MIVTCPSCNTPNPAIGHTLKDKEIINMRKIGLSEHLCKDCYHEKLSIMLGDAKLVLISLNEHRETTRLAYAKAYESWKNKAELYKAIDYNLHLIKFEEEKKTKPPPKQKDPSIESQAKIEKMAKQILASLSQEQQESILKLFQSIKPSEESYDSV